MSPRATKTTRTSTLLEDEAGFMRKPQVLAVLPLGERTWDRGVKEGRYPAPVKLSPRVKAWRTRDIRALVTALSTGSGLVVVLCLVWWLV